MEHDQVKVVLASFFESLGNTYGLKKNAFDLAVQPNRSGISSRTSSMAQGASNFASRAAQAAPGTKLLPNGLSVPVAQAAAAGGGILGKLKGLFKGSEFDKASGVLDSVRQGASSLAGHVRHHADAMELGGLGVLAVPGLDTVQAKTRAAISGDKSHDAVEKRQLLSEPAHAALDVGGLGILAAPYAAKFKRLGGSGLGGH